MTEFADLVRKSRADFPSNGAETIAIDVLARLDVDVVAAKILVPVVASAVAVIDRAGVRELERRAFPRSDADPVNTIAARAALLNRGFIIDGEWVAWGSATVDQHEARIAYLNEKVHGLQTTIDVHRDAIAQCHEHGVSCLAAIASVA